jgi:hypothetical protein
LCGCPSPSWLAMVGIWLSQLVGHPCHLALIDPMAPGGSVGSTGSPWHGGERSEPHTCALMVARTAVSLRSGDTGFGPASEIVVVAVHAVRQPLPAVGAVSAWEDAHAAGLMVDLFSAGARTRGILLCSWWL